MMYIKDCAFKRYWVKTVSLCQWRTKEQSVMVCRRYSQYRLKESLLSKHFYALFNNVVRFVAV